MSQDVILKNAYCFSIQDSQIKGNSYVSNYIIKSLNPGNFRIFIEPFDGHLREFRYYTHAIEPYQAMRMGFQRINILQSVYKLAFSLALDESFGVMVFEGVNGNDITLQSSNSNLP